MVNSTHLKGLGKRDTAARQLALSRAKLEARPPGSELQRLVLRWARQQTKPFSPRDVEDALFVIDAWQLLWRLRRRKLIVKVRRGAYLAQALDEQDVRVL